MKTRSNKTRNINMENDFLRSKLSDEFGMKELKTDLDPETENEWLKYLYEWETQFAENKQIKVFDRIGRPDFVSFENIAPEEVSGSLERLLSIMEENSLRIDFLCDYSDDVKYKFITEELFLEEIDDIRIKGMNTNFIYEEFHPNHEYDLRRDTTGFFESLFESNWNSEFDKIRLNEEIMHNNIVFERGDFGNKIVEFQKFNRPFEIKFMEIRKIEFCIDSGIAITQGKIEYQTKHNKHSGDFTLQFVFNKYSYWSIMDVMIPGLRFSKLN